MEFEFDNSQEIKEAEFLLKWLKMGDDIKTNNEKNEKKGFNKNKKKTNKDTSKQSFMIKDDMKNYRQNTIFYNNFLANHFDEF